MTTLHVLLAAALLPSARAAQDAPDGIDPLTLLEWKAACDLVRRHEAEIWPGYRLEAIPALFVHPKAVEVLVGHPKPPPEYVLEAGRTAPGGGALFVRRGATTFDGVTDTTTPIGGVTTLVVTDRGARNGSDDAWNLAVNVHEGFHAWAASNMKSIASGSELDLVDWPDLDAKVNAHLHLEGEALVAAVRPLLAPRAAEPAADELEEQALLFLAERTRRRATMPATAIRYEEQNELNEGLASYVELRAYELWAGHGLDGAMTLQLPKLGAAAFRDRAEGMLNMLLHSSRGTFSINGSSFGPGVVRRRGYFSGAAIGKLLDHFSSGGSAESSWKVEAAKGRSLTELLREALGSPSDEELAERADVLEGERGLDALVAAKEKLAGDARRERAKRIAAVLEGTAGTLLVIDLSELSPKGELLPSAWNPFGLLKLDESRRLFSQSSTSFVVGGVSIEALDFAGVIVDATKRELWLRTPIAADALKRALAAASGRYADAGVAIDATASKATFEVRDDPDVVRLLLHRAP